MYIRFLVGNVTRCAHYANEIGCAIILAPSKGNADRVFDDVIKTVIAKVLKSFGLILCFYVGPVGRFDFNLFA